MPRSPATPAKKATSTKRSAADSTPKKRSPATKASGTKKSSVAKRASKPVASKSTAKKKSTTKKSTAKVAPAAEQATKAPAKKSTKRSTARQAPVNHSAKKSPYGAKFIAAQEDLLLQERATYFHQYESLKAEADALVADFESGDVQFDEESGEGDTINIERERDLALSEQARQAVEEIDHALQKIKAGTYGVCEQSGEPIPRERLEAIPWARERVEYKIGGFSRR